VPVAKDLGVDNVLEVVQHVFNIDGEERGEEYYFPCINPNHADHKPSCSVNLETGLFFCFSCGSGGDLISLGSLALGVPKYQVESLLIATPTSEGYLDRLWNKLNSTLRKETKEGYDLSDIPGPYEAEPLDYLRGRGYEDTTLSLWGCRYVPKARLRGQRGDYIIQDYVGIPIRNQHGTLFGWTYRATRDDQKLRYTVTPGLPRNKIWFGGHLFHDTEEVVITEGEMDCMWVTQVGYPCLAMMGSNPSPEKIRWLKRYRKVTIFADRDSSGVQAVIRLGEQLRNRVDLNVARYSKKVVGKDPQELHPVDVEVAIETAMPYLLWKQRLEERRVG
jgi:5S rRNA maturation endonuclease (ribonuclease M5)